MERIINIEPSLDCQEQYLCSQEVEGQEGEVVSYRVCGRIFLCNGHVPDICKPDYHIIPQDFLQDLRTRVKSGEIQPEVVGNVIREEIENFFQN